MRQRLSVPSHLPRATLSLVLACCASSAWSADPMIFATPGSSTYQVPAGTGSLLVVVKGAAGGAGGWDDAAGGGGAGGSQVTATITVAGGETVNLIVGEGGEGTLGAGKNGMRGRQAFSSGGAGGGDGTRQDRPSLTARLAGAGGRGGDSGTGGSSPGGAGGGGASQLLVAGAAITAGGGGGGGSNSRIIVAGDWGNKGDPAVNALVLNAEDAACATPALGVNGVDGGAGVDGAGGSGGGGGYGQAGTQSGRGGAAGLDGSWGTLVNDNSGLNGEPGGSGQSCFLSAPGYSVTNTRIVQGVPSASAPTKGPSNPSGENGSISITAIPNALPTATPTLSGTPMVGQVLTGNYSYYDADADVEDKAATGTAFALVRSAAAGLTASAQGTVVQSGSTLGAPHTYTLAAADEAQYLSYCVTPKAATGRNPGAESCSPAVGPVAKAPVVVPPGPTSVTPVPLWDAAGLLLASVGLGGLAAWQLRRRQLRVAAHGNA